MQKLQEIQSNSEIKSKAYQLLKGRWSGPVITFLLLMLISFIINILLSHLFFGGNLEETLQDRDSFPFLNLAIYSLLQNTITCCLSIGVIIYFLNFIREKETKYEMIFSGFKQFTQVLIASILMLIIIISGMLFFIIPGIIASLGLSQTFYILADKPEISAIDALKESWEITKGYRFKIFLLSISFIPWAVLCILTLGIGFLWLFPYMIASLTILYTQLSAKENTLELV